MRLLTIQYLFPLAPAPRSENGGVPFREEGDGLGGSFER